MHMGNLLRQYRQGTHEMAAKQPTVGIAHPTVVPTNFVRADERDTDDDPDGDADDADG